MYICVYKMTEAETIAAFEGTGFRVCMPPSDYDHHNSFYWLYKPLYIKPDADYFGYIMNEHRAFLRASAINSRRVQFDVRKIDFEKN